jgi:hypothetical protein
MSKMDLLDALESVRPQVRISLVNVMCHCGGWDGMQDGKPKETDTLLQVRVRTACNTCTAAFRIDIDAASSVSPSSTILQTPQEGYYPSANMMTAKTAPISVDQLGLLQFAETSLGSSGCTARPNGSC